jgi:hypothetical protein
MDEFRLGHRSCDNQLLKQPTEDEAAGARGAPIKTEGELFQIRL